MELLPLNPYGHTFNDSFNLIQPGRWVESLFEFGPDPTVALNDFLTFFGADQFQGMRIVDWYVKSEQLDTGGTPTLKVNIGFGDPSGVSGTAGYRFATSRDLGHTASGSVIRDDAFACRLQNAPNLRLGISIAALPATAAFANKRIVFGVLTQTVMHNK